MIANEYTNPRAIGLRKGMGQTGVSQTVRITFKEDGLYCISVVAVRGIYLNSAYLTPSFVTGDITVESSTVPVTSIGGGGGTYRVIAKAGDKVTIKASTGETQRTMISCKVFGAWKHTAPNLT